MAIRIPLQYRRNCYYMIRQMILYHGTARAKRRFYWNLLIFVNNCFFFAPLLTMMATNYAFEWWRYEPISYYFYQNRDQYDYFQIGAIYLFEVFLFYTQYNYHRVPAHTPTWQWHYQLIAGLQDWHDQCIIKDKIKLERIHNRKSLKIQQNIQSSKYFQFVPSVLIEKYANVQANLEINLQFENVNKFKFFSKRLPMLADLSGRLRLKLLRFLIISDHVCCVLLLGLVVLYWPVSVGIFAIMFQPFPWYYLVWIIWDVIVVFDLSLQMTQSGFFFIQFTMISTITLPGHLNELKAKVLSLTNKYRNRLPVRHARLVHQLLVDHNRICYLVIACNAEMFANELFAFLLINIPVNIFLISRLVFVKLSLVNRAILWTMFWFQCIVFYLILMPLAYACTTYHSVEKIIPRLQRLMVGYRWMSIKLKYEDLLLRLLFGQKYGIRIGTLREVTNWALSELVMLYVGYLLMIFSQEIESRMNQNKA